MKKKVSSWHIGVSAEAFVAVGTKDVIPEEWRLTKERAEYFMEKYAT